MEGKKLARILSIIAVVLLTSLSIITLSVRQQLLTPSLYEDALSQSGIYTVTTEIIESKATDALISLEKGLVAKLGIVEQDPKEQTVLNTILLYVLDSVIETQTEKLVDNVSEQIQLEQLLQDITEEAIDRDIAWLKGEREAAEIFTYIPTPEQLEKVRDSSLTDFVNTIISNALGVNELPQCSTDQEVRSNLALIAQGKVLQVTCTSEQLQPLLEARVSSFVPVEALETAEEEINQALEAFELKPIIDDIYEISLILAELKQGAIELRTLVQTVEDVAMFGLLLSVVLLIPALWLTDKGERIKTFFTTYLATGLTMLALTAIHYLIVSNFILNEIPFNQLVFGTDALSATEGLLLTESIKSALVYIVKNAMLLAIYIGMVITAITSAALIIIWFLRKKGYSQPEDIKKLIDKTFKK